MPTQYSLLAAQNGTRVRVDSSNTTPITIVTGLKTEPWIIGSYIEVLNISASAIITFAAANGTTLNAWRGFTLKQGQYGRVSMVSADLWDLHIYSGYVAVVDVDGLTLALAGKADAGHVHPAIGVDDVTGLRGELDNRAFSTHVHPISQVTGLQGELDNRALSVHVHPISQVTGLQGELDNRAFSTHTHSIAQVAGLRAELDSRLQSGAEIKPKPLSTVAVNGSTDLGSAAHHNTHFRGVLGTTMTITVQPDSFWTGTDVYFANQYNPTNPGPMPIGGSVVFGKHGAGNVIFVPGTGVTINTPDTLTINKLHGKVTLIKIGPNEWDLEGNLGAP